MQMGLADGPSMCPVAHASRSLGLKVGAPIREDTLMEWNDLRHFPPSARKSHQRLCISQAMNHFDTKAVPAVIEQVELDLHSGKTLKLV